MSIARKVAVNAVALTVARFLLAGVGVVCVGIAARYLGLDAFGAFTTATAFVFMLGPLTELGIGTVGAREIAKRPDDAQRIFSAVFAAALALTAITVVVGFVGARILYRGGEHELARQGVGLLLLAMPMSAIGTAVGAVLVARQQAYLTVIASVAGSVCTLTILVLATALDWGYTGVVAAYAGTVVGYGLAMAGLSVGRVRLKPSLDVALVKQLMKWSLPIGGATILNYLYWRVDIVILSALAPSAEVARYGVAYKVVDVLIILPGYATVTLLPELARLERNPERLGQVMQKAFSVMQVGAVGLLVFFAGFSEGINVVIGGEKFEGGQLVLQILMIGVAVSYLTSIFGQALVALNRQNRLFFSSLVVLVANSILCLILVPYWGAAGAAAAFVASEIVSLAIAFKLYSEVGAVPRPHNVSRVLAAGLAMLAVVVCAQALGGSGDSVVELAVGGPAAVAVYVASLYALRAMPAEVHALIWPLWSRLRPQ